MSSKINYSILPEHIRDGAKRYIEQGVPPGDFLTAVICNNLLESVLRADSINIHRISDITSFFWNEAPLQCWGSGKRMSEWMKEKRLERVRQKKIDLSSIAK